MVRQNLFSRPEGIVDQSTPPFMSILDIDPWLIEPVWMFFDPSIYCEHRDPALASFTSWRPARRPLAAMVGQLQGDPGEGTPVSPRADRHCDRDR